MENLIKITDLNKKYGDKQVFCNLNIAFKKNCINFIMGKSGCGKTTLINILMGLENFESGHIEGINSKTIKSAVFQENRLCENLTVSANIRMVHKESDKRSKEELIEEIKNTLKKIGMEKTEDKLVSQLSGGMKRRIAILRGVMADSELIFLDEPLRGLDKKSERELMKIIVPMLMGKTVFWISHNDVEKEYFNDMPLCEYVLEN